MPAASRAQSVDRIATGHPCTGIAPIQGTLNNKVFIEGTKAAVKGDAIVPHTILVGIICVPHGAVVNTGSQKVFCEGIPLGRIGDSADAGAIISGSRKVFAGG